jgi:hypothetical protein
MGKLRAYILVFLASILAAGTSGCFPVTIGSAPIPVPVPPWVAERMKEKYEDRLQPKTPIMPPILPGTPLPTCEDPPSEEEMLRAIPPVVRGFPYVYEEHRDDFTFVVEKLVDTIDPPTFVPLVGPSQLHHCHYKCTIYYRETIRSYYPFPFTVNNDKREEVYIDKDHLHVFAGEEAVRNSMSRDLLEP